AEEIRRILSRLLAMVFSSDLFAAGAEFGQNDVDAVLVDGAHGIGGNAQLHPAVLAGDPEPALAQVGKETAAGLVVGVRDVVAGLHALAGDLANSGHNAPRWCLGVPHGLGDGGPGMSLGDMPCDAGSGSRPGGAPESHSGPPGPPLRGGRTQRAKHYAGYRPSPASRGWDGQGQGGTGAGQRWRRSRSRTPSRVSRSV